MAKKIVRGITDIKTISNQDLDTNNVNDLLSDGEHNYIHRKKKDGSEEYHNLTNNLKTIQSDDTDLVSVTNYNNTTNSATIRPKHDVQKEQLLESTDETIVISHGENGTEETTSVDVNPAKVLEHDNLISNSDYVTIEHEDDSNTSVISTDKLESELEIVGLRNYVLGSGTAKSASDGILYNLSSTLDDDPEGEPFIIDFDWSVTEPTETSKFRINRVIKYSDGTPDQWCNIIYKDGESSDVSTASGTGHFTGIFNKVGYIGGEVLSRYLNLNQTEDSGTVTISNLTIRRGYLKSDWTPAPEDSQIVSNNSIGVDGNELRQLYTKSQTYTHTNATLKTHVKSVSQNTSISTLDEEFNFLAKMDKGSSTATFSLNEHDTVAFQNIINTYGENGTVNISGCAFSLSNSTLTFNCNSASYNPYVVSFSDIITTQTE